MISDGSEDRRSPQGGNPFSNGPTEDVIRKALIRVCTACSVLPVRMERFTILGSFNANR